MRRRNVVCRVLCYETKRHQTLLVANMHRHMKRSTTSKTRRTPPRRATTAVGSRSNTFLSPPPVSPRTLKVIEDCTQSSTALHRAATASMQVHQPPRSPVRGRDGRTSLSPLKESCANTPPPSTGNAPAIVQVGTENVPPANSATPNANPSSNTPPPVSPSSHSKKKKNQGGKVGFRFADVVKAAVRASKFTSGAATTIAADAVDDAVSNSPAPHVGRSTMTAVEHGSVVVAKGQKYAKLLNMFRVLRSEHLELRKAKAKAEEDAATAAQAAATALSAAQAEAKVAREASAAAAASGVSRVQVQELTDKLVILEQENSKLKRRTEELTSRCDEQASLAASTETELARLRQECTMLRTQAKEAAQRAYTAERRASTASHEVVAQQSGAAQQSSEVERLSQQLADLRVSEEEAAEAHAAEVSNMQKQVGGAFLCVAARLSFRLSVCVVVGGVVGRGASLQVGCAHPNVYVVGSNS